MISKSVEKRLEVQLSSNPLHHISPGVGASTTGNKFDQGKPEVFLNPAEATLGVASVFTFGKTKYGAHNWRKGIQYSRLISSLERHIQAFKMGERLDPESGLFTVDHITANAMMLSTFEHEDRSELDDRYKPDIS